MLEMKLTVEILRLPEAISSLADALRWRVNDVVKEPLNVPAVAAPVAPVAVSTPIQSVTPLPA